MPIEYLIKELKELKTVVNYHYSTIIYYTIENLKKQSNIHDKCKKCVEFSEYQPSEDCISREDLLNDLYCDAPKDIMGYIAKYPSVTPSHMRRREK